MKLPVGLAVIGLAVLFLLLDLSGCATLETGADHVRDFATAHPVVTGVGAGLLVGGIAIAVDHHHHQAAPAPHRIVCSPGVTACGSEP